MVHDWRHLSPATLDDAYANAPYIFGSDRFPARWAARARAFRDRLGEHAVLDLAYGPAPRERLDLFRPSGDPRGLVVFVHGGYWHRFAKSDWSHLAVGALDRGFAVAMPGYTLAPDVRIADITRQVAVAIDRAAALVGGPVHLTGHSAGGHLVARMAMADARPACATRIARVVPLSPVADLRPLVPQAMNAVLRLDEGEARAESPALGRPVPGVDVRIHVGGDERPSFLWQSEALARAWDAPLRVAAGRHHFDVIDGLADAGSALVEDLVG
ncbi:alpha/beta hydrolase [Jannaschia sp. LMIT008]|uniref:alpha/beta hydrolase n=1 Tax=Jannaschia maritima TaxID=3032585 RepID=UPI0028124115|nr:alpha/beta hydrolase [Jannaschia sp. LMIT008]